MKVKQAKLAQALRGDTSNIIDDKKYSLEFDKGMLHAELKSNPKAMGPFIIFPANIAYIEHYKEGVEGVKAPETTPPLQPATSSVKAPPKKPKS